MGSSGDISDLVAPFVGELLAEAEALGCAPEISLKDTGDDTITLVPERGPALAAAGQDLVVGFLLVVSGSIAGGVAQAIGADIYQHALKNPLANLAQRLRSKSESARRVTVLAETWVAEDRVLVQVVVRWRPDEQPDLAGVLTDALDTAETFWRAPGSPSGSSSAGGRTRIVRVDVIADGTMTQPVLIEPQHRLPGMPRLHPSTSSAATGLQDDGAAHDQGAHDDDPGSPPVVS